MNDIISITLRLGKRQGESYPLVLSWMENGVEQSVEDNISGDLRVRLFNDDVHTYRDTFVEAEGEKSKLSTIGQHLFALLHESKPGLKLDELKESKGEGNSLRILLDIKEEELALLPWELMYDGVFRPFQDTEDTIIRVHNYNKDAVGLKAEPINWPIRILVVAGVVDKEIGIAKEIENIEDAIRKVRWLVDLEVIDQPPTINDLEKVCKETFRPHVFHYIGHGGVDEHGYLMLRKPGGGNESDTWTAGQIHSSLKSWEWVPRFAFINACRSADKNSTVQHQKNTWAVGDAFRALGVPAVLTMQANVEGNLAGQFAGMLYERLAMGASIDRAIAAARIRMRDNTTALNKDNSRAWATPTLTLSIPPERVLSLKSKSNGQREQDINGCTLFQDVSVFANRRHDRRHFIHALYPIPPQQPDKELIFVRGETQMGKTWMTLWGLESYARQGHDVRYVEVASLKSPKWLDVLMQIQKGDPKKDAVGKLPLIYRPLDPKAFNQFNHELPYRLRNEMPEPWKERDVPPPEDLNTDELDNLPETTVKEIFKSFCKALVAAAEPNNPLIIVLDKFISGEQNVTEPHMNKFLLPYLFEEAAERNLKSRDGDITRSVKLVLVLNDQELKFYTNNDPKAKLNLLRRSSYEVHLEGIPDVDFGKVAMEFFRNLKAAPDCVQGDYIKNLTEIHAQMAIESMRPFIEKKWPPFALKLMRRSLEDFEKMRLGKY